ncbi:hypothetical protein RHMOL_Rhmol06G0007500 [Rhododendron molle]|uniref:Uncharacterized protein n=2 Tax=Rhododendron molle TaxID=49168 RepID=A0ACC0N7Y7_RHOML|nr:hypothetical protein RHMOL_Rhmol06G0007500 [Rhododendron molle]KAI8549195.1 hypothetical protein RHMOL_Rhmol06G0007500 [Rhododendron molle]
MWDTSTYKNFKTEANRGTRFLGCINYKQPSPSGCDFFFWIDPKRDMQKELLEADNNDMRRKISILTKEVEEITRENKVLRKKNEKLTKKLQEAEAQVFDYKMKWLIILVVCIVVWFLTNVVAVPNMRNLKYLP